MYCASLRGVREGLGVGVLEYGLGSGVVAGLGGWPCALRDLLGPILKKAIDDYALLH